MTARFELVMWNSRSGEQYYFLMKPLPTIEVNTLSTKVCDGFYKHYVLRVSDTVLFFFMTR